MKSISLALRILAFVLFILHVWFEARPIPATASTSLSRPSMFLGMGLSAWVLAEILMGD